MSKITKTQFLADVTHEIEMLKLHATEEEKRKLNINRFSPNRAETCIYGQMTGDCRTDRAFSLMELSCTRTFDLQESDLCQNDSFTTIQKLINGAFKGQGWDSTDNNINSRSWRYLSALEGYIQINYGSHANILSYIKGEIDTLKL